MSPTTYSQNGRPLRVTTVLGEDVLLITGMSGVEADCMPFEFTLDLVSTNPEIDPAKLLRTGVGITITQGNGATRRLHGLVRRFVQLGRLPGGLVAYRAEIVPWLWFLALSHDCRVFQNASVLDIAEAVFRAQGFTDYKNTCTQAYKQREYCVQYRETAFAFISRLFEEEGIFYFFEHQADKHVLTIADGPSAVKPAPGFDKISAKAGVRPAGNLASQAPTLLELVSEQSVGSGMVTLWDHGIDPSVRLQASISGKGKGELFDFPGKFEAKADGDRIARLRLEQRESELQIVKGRTTAAQLQSGCRLDVTDYYRRDLNTAYHILSVRHNARQGGFGGGEGESAALDYKNEFTAIPHAVPYRPPLHTPRPIVHGTQTALVVGPAGEEIYVDKYGRVKVQFFWDRQGKKDEKSSCWIRVSSTWAGRSWGAIQIPRVGQEVVVDFLEGDPDRPIVVGSVYNAQQMPPYDLPANGTQSGVRTRSSKGGSADTFSELRFDDHAGSEVVSFRAQKDLTATVLHDATLDIRNDRTTVVKNNDVRTVNDGDDKLTVDKGDQRVTISQGDQTVDISMGRQKITIQGDRSVVLKQGNDELTIQTGNLTTKLSMGSVSTKTDLGSITSEAMQTIELKVGQSSVVIDQSGVTIQGMTVSINGQMQTQLTGMMTTVKADAMLAMSGALTTIN